MYLFRRLLTIDLLFIVGTASVLPLSYAEQNTVKLNAEGAGRYVLAGRILPKWIEAPPRRIDATVAADKGVRANSGNVFVNSLRFSTLPFDFNEYPVLTYPFGALGSDAIELDLDVSRAGRTDAVLRIGNPAFFPEMLAQRIDLAAADFVPKNLAYKLKRKLGMKSDGSWRYTSIGSDIKQISHGHILSTFSPRGEIVIQKDLPSIDLAVAPWFRYEYELPNDDLPWLMHFEIKIKRSAINPVLLRVVSKPVKGGGKHTVIANPLDMIRQAEPDAQGGRLEELIIHFSLENASSAVNNVRIKPGKLEWYKQYIPANQGKIEAHLIPVAEDNMNVTDIAGMEFKRLFQSVVTGGRLLSFTNPQNNPESQLRPIMFNASYKDKVPELFVGHAEYLDDLNAQELDAVLDEKMFLEKRILWQPTSRPPVSEERHSSVHSLAAETPLAQYTPQVRLEGDAYIKVDYTLRDKENRRVYLLMRGKNSSGGIVELEKLANPGQLIRVKDITLNNLEFVLRPGLSEISQTSFFQMNNIEISSYVKSPAYQIRPSEAYFTIDGAPVPMGDPLWKTNKKSLPLSLDKSGDLNLIRVFPANLNFQTNAFLRLALQKPADPDLELFLKIEGENVSGGQLERLYPIIEGRLNTLVNHSVSRLSILGRSPHGTLYQRNSGAQLELEFLTIESLGKPESYAVTSVDYGPSLLGSGGVLANRIDTTLSLEEIWRGGKKVIFSTQYLAGGSHVFNYHSAEGIALEVNELQTWDEYAAANKGVTAKPAPQPAKLRNSLLKLFLVLAGVVAMIFLWRYWGYAAAQAFDRAQSTPLAFYITQLVLWASGIYFAFFTSNLNAASWGGVIMVLAYGLAVRYKLRPYFAGKWPYLADKKSAPYFMMVLAIFLLIAIMLVLKQQFLAEVFAVLAYYLLVLGVVLEFIQFSREPANPHSALGK